MEEISTYLEAFAQVLNTSIKKANRHDAENTINQLYMWGIIFFFVESNSLFWDLFILFITKVESKFSYSQTISEGH